MQVLEYIGMIIAGAIAGAVFMIVALLVLGAVILALAAAADLLARSSRTARSGPAARDAGSH